ncbi:hypothetical protein PFISCL1PPCAC_7992, partial [Pristionchus fissidentatus]
LLLLTRSLVRVPWLEALEESDVLGEIGENPQFVLAASSRPDETEENRTQDGNANDDSEEANTRHGQVVDALTDDRRPEREAAASDSAQDHEYSDDLLVQRRRVVDPHVAVIRVAEALDGVLHQLHLLFLLLIFVLLLLLSLGVSLVDL